MPDRQQNSHREAVPDWLFPLVCQIVGATGTSDPGGAGFVVTTRQAAMRLIGAGVDSDPPVYYVVVHGNFVDENAKVPAGAPMPTGTVIDFTVDCATRDILDFGIGPEAPDIAALGPVHDFRHDI